MKLSIGIAFVIGILTINECSGNINPYPAVGSKVLTFDPELARTLSNYWSTEFDQLRAFKKDIEKNVDSQSFWVRSRWIQSLIVLSNSNRATVANLLITTSTIGDEFIGYVDSIARSGKLIDLNVNTRANIWSIVSYASQFKVSMKGTFLRTPFFEDFFGVSGYHALLMKYKENIKELNPIEIKKLKDISEEITSIVAQYGNDVLKASTKFSKHFETFTNATNGIGLALRLIDPKIKSVTFNPAQVANPMANLRANIGICLEQISDQRLLLSIQSDLGALNNALKIANDVQYNFPKRIEEVLKGGLQIRATVAKKLTRTSKVQPTSKTGSKATKKTSISSSLRNTVVSFFTKNKTKSTKTIK